MKNLSEWTKCGLAVLTIVTVLTFSLSPIPDLIHGIAQSKAPWLHRTEADMILDLRFEIFNLELSNSFLSRENFDLRRLVFTTKPEGWLTWLDAIDVIKHLQIKNDKLRLKIKHLEIQLQLRTPDLLQPMIPEA